MKPADLGLLRWPSSPTVSPDGARVAFVVNRIDLEVDGYRSDLWVVPADGSGPSRQLTRGGFDSIPRWSPDGDWLAFRRGGEDLPGHLHLLPVDGGEAVKVVEHPLGVEDIAWSRDGTLLAYTARVPEGGRYEKGDKARPPGKEAPRRIDRLRYRIDGVGFLLDRPVHLFVVDPHAGAPEARQLTHEDWGFAQPTWTPDGRYLVVATGHTDDEMSMAGDLYAVAAGGGDRRRITRSTTTVGPLAISEDGATVFYLGVDDLDLVGRSTSLFTVPFDASAPPRRLTEPDDWNLADVHVVGKLIRHGGDLLAPSARRGSVDVVRISNDSVSSGSAQPEVAGGGSHMMLDFSAAGPTLASVVATASSAGEIAVLRNGQWSPLTDVGAELARSTPILPLEEVAAEAPDGYPVHGWLVCPPGTGPHPVLLVIHGGPATQYGYQLFDEAQMYAAAGYAVVLGNPRGSSGYGQAHSRAIVGDMGNLDRQDLLALLDRALEDERLDGERVGVMGGSYGGYMTTWLAGHDSARFRAAISERAVNAWDSLTGSSDIGWYFTDMICGPDPQAQARQSPLTYADGIDIPVLIIHSESDWRCPIEQAQRLFVHLKRRGVPVEMLVFPGEGHELSRSGLPSHRLARFEAILEWWGRHL
jgi:dipeptidyl aminopeptidase/acylaminoacyl peptidase